MLGGSQALYHHCLSNSILYSGQIQHPLTAVRATLGIHRVLAEKAWTFLIPRALDLSEHRLPHATALVCCWGSGKRAVSPPRWRWNGQICFILHRQLNRSCKSATKGPRGQHTNPSTDFQQKHPWVFQLCFTKCKKLQQLAALLFSRLRRTYPSRSWHADTSKAANTKWKWNRKRIFFQVFPHPGGNPKKQFFHHHFQKMNHPAHKSPPNACVSVLAVLPRKTQVRYCSGKRHTNPPALLPP